MKKQIHLRSFIEGPRWTTLDKFLIHCSDLANVKLTFIETNKDFFNQSIDFKISGYEEDVYKFEAIFNDVLDNLKYNSFNPGKFKVEEINMTEPNEELVDHNNTYIATVKSHRFSAIKKLGEQIRDEFNLNIHIKEEKNYFSKKTTFILKSKSTQFTAFKNLFLKFVVSKKPFIIIDNLEKEVSKNINKQKI